ncbi:sensor histidine kinase [Ilumatobacter sp.]|uniref:sensor histidine kinase n=1 Tax=Ilumatobacter sp. TaxID=1967498 RepID=UPI003B51737E
MAVTIGLLVTVVFAIPFAWLLFAVARGLSRVQRSRVAGLLGVEIADPVPPLRSSGFVRRLWERARCQPRWREIAHHLVRLPVDAIGFAVVVAVWCGSLALIALPAYVSALPDETAKFYFFEIGQGGGAATAVVVGLVGILVVAPPVTAAVASIEATLAQALIGPRGDELLRAEVSRLESRRSAAVVSAETERRRIERDLHDGAQQRLVSLAADLGAARDKLAADTHDIDDAIPSADRLEATRLVIDAHEEAKAALREIRDLVRGIHPVILEDRGLDAALSAVVARSPVPVTLDVDLAAGQTAGSVRLPAPVESAAYFVVSEALANVARHAQASRAVVSIARSAGRLVVEVRDDGIGGADASRGTGLQGLRDRVTGLGGTVHVLSPVGGPTTLTVELPCAS